MFCFRRVCICASVFVSLYVFVGLCLCMCAGCIVLTFVYVCLQGNVFSPQSLLFIFEYVQITEFVVILYTHHSVCVCVFVCVCVYVCVFYVCIGIGLHV